MEKHEALMQLQSQKVIDIAIVLGNSVWAISERLHLIAETERTSTHSSGHTRDDCRNRKSGSINGRLIFCRSLG
jgi:hypothetical protein